MQNLIKTLMAMGLIGSVISVSSMSMAQAVPAKCGERDKIIKVLKKEYKEAPFAMGLSQKSTEAFEIYTSEKGTWTVMMTMSNGQTCIMAAGHSWQNLPQELAGVKT